MSENLIPGEEELLDQLALLLETQSSRYETQAIEFLENKKLDIQCNSVEINYRIKDGYFCYKYRNISDGALQESERLAPEDRNDQMQTLIFMFALSEAAVLT